MKKLRIGINGFGRIGRVASRIIVSRTDVELVAINSRSEVESHAYLLKHDSTHGMFPHAVLAQENSLLVDQQTITCFREDHPETIPWDSVGVDLVIEASGKFTKKEDALKHMKPGVSTVIISAPSADADKTIVMGVNEKEFDSSRHKVVSNASCTTNCTAVVAHILHTHYGIKRAMMTTIHAATQSQSILDSSSKKDIRGGRSVLNNIIPTSTGASKAVSQVIPDLEGKLSALSLRVPVNDGSIIDFVAEVEKSTTVAEINSLFEEKAKGDFSGILFVSPKEIVSSDIIGSSFSAVVDPFLTSVLGGNLIKVLAWYDNEWGYATRLIDLCKYIGERL